MTNDRSLSPAQVLEAHKGQPMIEKRFEQVKTVHEIAPVFLKDEGRIEALFTLYFLALLVQALIERELRLAMTREHIDELPLYPEQRQCTCPATEQILRMFSLAARHKLIEGAHNSVRCSRYSAYQSRRFARQGSNEIRAKLCPRRAECKTSVAGWPQPDAVRRSCLQGRAKWPAVERRSA